MAAPLIVAAALVIALHGAAIGADVEQKAAFDAAASSESDAPAEPRELTKTCGEVLYHRRVKDSVRHLPPHERRKVFEEHGFEPVDPWNRGDDAELDAELAALYVVRELDSEEQEAMRGWGVRIVPGLYVPPVQPRPARGGGGRMTPGHPHGFYVALIEYASLAAIEDDDRFVRISSMEGVLEPMNDLAIEEIHADLLHAGVPGPSGGIGPLLGTGVGIAVADSGVDLSHPDLPTPIETYNVTTGMDATEWATNVQNTVIWHGTHVSGTAVGSGAASAGQYVGGAPGADFYFYKIGNNSNGNATFFNMTKAVNRALEVGCRVFTLSYGGFDSFMDGSISVAQAFDAAFEQGMIGFTSAGNLGQRQRHYSVELDPQATAGPIELLVANPSNNSPYTPVISLRIIWLDDPDLEDNLSLIALDLGEDESLDESFFSTSPRETKVRGYLFRPQVAPGDVASYQFELTNSAPEGSPTPLVHLYQTSTNNAGWADDDPMYTVTTPANADLAVAVGAWRHRSAWIDYFGNDWFFGSGDGILAPFSSLGPRIDGLLKPEITAPGSMTISLRDSQFANASSSIISNDGSNNGTGPADYYAAQGTSMASPLAAGATALLIEHEPLLTPAEVLDRITSTAADAENPNPFTGFGLIDILAAVEAGQPQPAAGDLDGDGAVGVPDLLLLLAAWGVCGDCAPELCPADLDGECTVGVPDLLILLGNWG